MRNGRFLCRVSEIIRKVVAYSQIIWYDINKENIHSVLPRNK